MATDKVIIQVHNHLRHAKDREVTFGRKGASDYAVYIFKPKYPEKDRFDPKNPHICEVGNDDHIAKFLAIAEGYKIHRGDDSADDAFFDDNENKDEGKFSNLPELDVASLTDEDLRQFSRQVMEVNPNNKKEILAFYKENFDEELDSASNVTDLLRKCAEMIVQKEQMIAGAEI